MREALAEQWAAVAGALAAADPGAPARCPGWQVADVAALLAARAAALARDLAEPEPARRELDLLGLVRHRPGAAPAGAAPPGAPSPGAPSPDAASPDAASPDARDRFGAAVRDAQAALAGAPRRVLVGGPGGAARLVDVLRLACLDAVVGGRDLPDPAEPAPAALRVAVRAAAELLAAAHPGRTVEVRVPPYAAVQCIGGPVHSRGTPPNVVETDPLTFCDLAAGRVAFGAAAGDGRLRASGGRADLSGVLPLVR